MAPKIMCTCGCERLVTRDTNRRHLQGLGTVTVKMAQQRKILELRRLRLRRQALTRAHSNQTGSSTDRRVPGTPPHSPLPDISSDVQMQEDHDIPLRVSEDDPYDTFIEDPASPPNATGAPDSPDPLPPDPDVESHQDAATTFLIENASGTNDAHIPPDHEIEPNRFFQRCRVWPADGAPAFHPTIDELGAGWLADDNDPDHGDHRGDEFLREFDEDEDEEPDTLTDDEHSSRLQGMSAHDELALNFERDVAASGMYSP